MEELIKEKKLPNYTPFCVDEKYKKSQEILNFDGIEIYFPYKIYNNQRKYMQNIIKLLNDKLNNNTNGIGALESPTGTGKTLCILCSTLAWVNEMRKQKKYGGKILYTTRTHSQITQIIRELRKTCYKPKTAILSSRDYSCVNDEIKKNQTGTGKITGTILNIKCRKFSKKCPFYKGINPEINEKVNMMDIEDLVKIGKKLTFCPFYQQYETAKNSSDIVFMPYNYIFDEDINKIMEIDIENSIIIIDEAHNVRKVCEDSKSVEIKSTDFEDIILDLKNILNFDENQYFLDNYFKFNKIKKKKKLFEEISKDDILTEIDAINEILIKFNDSNFIIEKEGKNLEFSEFLNIFINNEENKKNKRKNKRKLNDKELVISGNITISNLNDHIEFLNEANMTYQDIFEKGSKISVLLKILTIISKIILDKNLQKSYTFYIENEEKKKYNQNTNEIDNYDFIRKLNIFCFSPKIEFSDILKNNPFSIILTSGTLAPFKIYEDELNIKFESTLENEHIVPEDQIQVNIISNYSTNGRYLFDYKNRNNDEMIIALGKEIYNYCKNTPYGGILVFFPSYFYLNYCNKIWNNSGVNDNIRKYKRIYIDSISNKNIVTQIKNESNKNFIFYSVFRGSSSEGIDFSDDSARVVICVGIPFADKKENRIKLKIDYLNNIKKEKENTDIKNLIDGTEW